MATASGGGSLRVLLADDHHMVRDGMRPFLERLDDRVEVLEAASLPEVLAFANADLAINLILLDLQMPGMRGVASVTDVCSAFAGVPVVVISGASDNATITAALGFGAAGFVPKTSRGKSLVSALKLVLDGDIYVPPLMVHQNMEPNAPNGSSAPPGVPADSPLNKLSPREAASLRLLMEGKTNKEIARALELQEITVKVQLRSVFRKIGASNRTDAVRIAMQQNWGHKTAVSAVG